MVGFLSMPSSSNSLVKGNKAGQDQPELCPARSRIQYFPIVGGCMVDSLGDCGEFQFRIRINHGLLVFGGQDKSKSRKNPK